ncbi:MAG TPA: transglutaminase domain-containing protein, partial [Noviherbaspirillum sp.]
GKRWDATVKILPISADSVTANPLKILQIPILSHCIYAAGAVRDLLDEFSCHRFFMLPEDCRWDMDFIDRNQICECGGASKRMFFRAQEQGIEARQCFGLLLAAPFSTGHYWTEFKIDGEWTPFDPLLLGLLHATSRLDQQAWPTHRSNSAALHRLCVIDSYDANGVPELDNYIDEPYVSNPLVIMDGQVLAVSLPTELSQHPAEASDRNLQPQWTQKAVG